MSFIDPSDAVNARISKETKGSRLALHVPVLLVSTLASVGTGSIHYSISDRATIFSILRSSDSAQYSTEQQTLFSI